MNGFKALDKFKPGKVKEALNKSSCSRKWASSLLIYLDSRLRGSDEFRLIQCFLKHYFAKPIAAIFLPKSIFQLPFLALIIWIESQFLPILKPASPAQSAYQLTIKSSSYDASGKNRSSWYAICIVESKQVAKDSVKFAMFTNLKEIDHEHIYC